MRLLLLPLALAVTAPAFARDSATEALAGHRAEQRQWEGGKDPLRRAFFLEPVDIESPTVGLDCAHRPQSSSGEGYVVLIETLETPPRRIRFFAAPGTLPSLAAARVAAMDFARSRAPGLELHQIGARTFLWCR